MTDLELILNGDPITAVDDGGTLMHLLREQRGITSVKDGCAPQGQCGCCTVLVDGRPRVSCVTPARRVRGREVTTIEGLAPSVCDRWGQAFCAAGASQCGFCTPGIIMRLEGLRRTGTAPVDRHAVNNALLAHLCRCTGWTTIVDAHRLGGTGRAEGGPRDLDAASARATIEGGSPQRVDPSVALGRGGFADDTAPSDALVAVLSDRGEWVVAESVTQALATAGRTPGRSTTLGLRHPIDVPDGDFDATLQTTWVEPAYLEPDAAWCAPGGEPCGPLTNGGAFGGKATSELAGTARRLADVHGRPVRVLYRREDVVRRGPKRPPMAGGMRSDGTGVIRVARTPGISEAISSFAPRLEVEEVDVSGPPTSALLRAAGWAEVAALAASAGSVEPVRAPNGAVAAARVDADGVWVQVDCGDPLDDVVLRSYCIGAAHMALSWVWSEGIVVDSDGIPHDLTIRSFGVLRAVDMPTVTVEIVPSTTEPIGGSDAVFAAVAAAATVAEGRPTQWPTRRRSP